METEERQVWKQKRIFLAMSALFLVYWVWYSSHLIAIWRSMDPRMHLDSCGLAVFSIGLWLILLKEKASGFAMMMAAFGFIAAIRLLLHA